MADRKLSEIICKPANKGEQIDASIRFILNDEAYFDSLRTRPRRLESAAITLVKTRQEGFHFQVIRKALWEMDQKGCIDPTDKPYTHDELYEE